jgi:WD40 repeat protein
MNIKVWDLVIKKEIANLRPGLARITSIVFSQDVKTMMVGDKDGRVTFFSVSDNYRTIAAMDAFKDMGLTTPVEVNTLCPFTINNHQYMALGTNVGQLAIIDLHTQKVCHFESDFISSETIHIFYIEPAEKLYCLNQD